MPAILVTGMQEEGLLVEALRAGVRDFVPKTPNFLNHLEPIVARVLDQVRTERELAESRVVARANEERRRELEHEIAQRKRVEQALREAEENLRRMVESVKDVAIFTVDPHGRIASWNPGAEHLFGYAEPEILGRGFAVIFTPEDRDAGVPERELATAAARGARVRRALAPAQGRQPLLRQRRDEPDLRRGGPPLRLHQGRARHHRAQPRRGGRPRGRRPAQGHRRHGRRRHHHHGRTRASSSR